MLSCSSHAAGQMPGHESQPSPPASSSSTIPAAQTLLAPGQSAPADPRDKPSQAQRHDNTQPKGLELWRYGRTFSSYSPARPRLSPCAHASAALLVGLYSSSSCRVAHHDIMSKCVKRVSHSQAQGGTGWHYQQRQYCMLERCTKDETTTKTGCRPRRRRSHRQVKVTCAGKGSKQKPHTSSSSSSSCSLCAAVDWKTDRGARLGAGLRWSLPPLSLPLGCGSSSPRASGSPPARYTHHRHGNHQ